MTERVDKAVVTLPLPRVVTGIPRRCRKVERIAVHDPVPLLLGRMSGERVPFAIESPLPPGAEAVFNRRHRAGSAGFLRPLDYGSELDGVTPEAFGRVFLGRLGRHLGQAGTDTVMRQEFADWKSLFAGVDGKRGLGTEDSHGFLAIEDDGRKAQAALARHVQDMLVLVDGRLHARVPPPHYQVLADQRRVAIIPRSFDAPMLDHVPFVPEWRESFAPHRYDDAVRFCEALVERDREAGGSLTFMPPTWTYRILDAEAVEAACPDPSPGAAAARAAREHALASRALAGFLDDEGVAMFLGNRAIPEAGVPDEEAEAVVAAMDALAGKVDALAARGMPPGADYQAFNRALDLSRGSHRAAALRWEVLERPRLGLGEADAFALANFRP